MWTGFKLFRIGTSDVSHTKRHFVVTNRYTVLRGKGKTLQIPNRPLNKHVTFLRKHKWQQFSCGHTILTKGVFVTHLPNNAQIPALRGVQVTINCCFTSDMTTRAVALLQKSLGNLLVHFDQPTGKETLP
jgi:hypothetical protein